MNRRALIVAGAGGLIAAARRTDAQTLTPLDVAYAGSMGSLMEGPIKSGAATALHVDLHGRAQGSDALAQLIAGGSIAPDVFVPVTPAPMMTVLKAGKATEATPIARTEMVIAYSPTGRFARAFADAAAGKRGALPWYRILQQRGLRFGRTDPATDPQGRNIIFTLQLAETYYREPGLARAILGDVVNPAQIFSEPTVEARLQSGELDAAAAYKIQPGPFDLPAVTLPSEINLGNESLHDRYGQTSLALGEKTYRPEALVYYAAALDAANHKERGAAFVRWLAGPAQPRLRRAFYDAPTGAVPLRA